MSDLQLLLLIVVLIYLSECCFWVRRGSVVLRPRGAGGYAIAYPSRLLGNEHGGLVFLNPLPPFGPSYICRFWPYSLTETAACSLPPQSLDPAGHAVREPISIPFDKIEKISESEGNLLINGKRFIGMGEEHIAANYSKLLTRIWKKPLSKRRAAIDTALARASDVEQIHQRLDLHRERAGALRLLCHLLFVLLLIVPFLALRLTWLLSYWPIFLMLLLACVISIAGLFYSAHKRLLPGATVRRWKSFAIILLTPTAAVRAFDALSRDVLGFYDPLACASVLCEAPVFHSFARRVLQDLRHPLLQDNDRDGWPIKQAAATTLLARMETLVRSTGNTIQDVIASPAAQESSCISYCPRCDAQYEVATGSCEDCGGIALLPIDAGKTMSPKAGRGGADSCSPPVN